MEQEKDPKKEIPLSKVIILSTFALVVLFIFAFACCYGCTYQPITPPDPEEAVDVIAQLEESNWVLDDAEGVPVLQELGGRELSTIAFSIQDSESELLPMQLGFAGLPKISGTLAYEEDSGFTFMMGNQALNVEVVYSQSKDKKTETLTLKGKDSNIHCYYLKK